MKHNQMEKIKFKNINNLKNKRKKKNYKNLFNNIHYNNKINN